MVTIAILMYLSVTVTAQKSISPYGKIEKAEIEMKDCDFDKGAVAVKLLDWGNTYYTKGTVGVSEFKTIFEKRTRIKILKEKGIALADIKIRFSTSENGEQITKFNASTYNADAAGNIKTTPVTRQSIYTKKINKDYSEMIISFPEVKVGSIIEYKYTMERETMSQLPDWFFQGDIPVKYSEYQLAIPQIFRFIVKPSVIDPMEEKKKVANEIIARANGVVSTKILTTNYIMRNLAAIKEEPFMGASKDYMQRLEFQLTQIDYGNNKISDLRSSWSDVLEELNSDEHFGVQLEKEMFDLISFIDEVKSMKEEDARIKKILNTVRQQIEWNGENAIYTDKGITKAWTARKGNIADINLLLINLLNAAGIKAFPILLSTKDNGQVSPYYLQLSQFNTVMAYIPQKEGYLVFDATDKLTHYRLIPEKIVNSKGFIVDDDEGQWKDIEAGKHKYKITAAVQGNIDTLGIMKGNAFVSCLDYAKTQRCESWLQDKAQFKNDYFLNRDAALKIELLTVNNAAADSLPLEQSVKFSMQLSGSGDYKYFSANLFSGFDDNPFIADDRIADIDFGYQQEYVLFVNCAIPDNYKFDVLPENMSMIMPDTSIIFSRSIQAEENLLNLKIAILFNRPVYAATLYPELKDFYKKLFAKLNEQIIIKKKNTQ